MADESISTDTASDSICPWCSAALTPGAATCPSCGANLTSDDDHELPGVNAIDQDVVRGLKKPPARSRLLSWISGDYEPGTPSLVEAGALAPPDQDVQREILRLEIEAEVANLQAEAGARYAEALAEGRVQDLPEGLEAIATGSAPIEGLVPDAVPALHPDATESVSETDAPAGDTPTA
jgi:hypothetical protein